MARTGVIYKITIPRWNDHNKGHKKSFKKTMISNNFCTDNKLGVLPLSHRWLFLGLLLECGNGCRDTIEMNERQLRALLESSKSIDRALHALQSLHLVTVEKRSLIEEKRIEKKGKERKAETLESVEAPKLKQPEKNLELLPQATAASLAIKPQNCVAFFCDLWKEKHGSNPTILGKDAGQLKRVEKDIGLEKLKRLLIAYFNYPDALWFKKRHPVGIFISSINEITAFMEKGSFATMTDVRKADETIHYRKQRQDDWESLTKKQQEDYLNCFDKPQVALNGGTK